MDVDSPPVDLTSPLDHSSPHPESNTAEMEAAWTNCSQRVRVDDDEDDDHDDSDGNSSFKSMDLDSDINPFSDDMDEDDKNETHQQNFCGLGLGFQLRAAQAGES